MCRDSLKHCCRCAICSALPTVQSIVSIDQTLGKGEPTMRSHWTNPTIIRRPTIAALSAAALLVACDQPTDPASRPGGVIVADAQATTVSAHGNGQVANYAECRIATAGCVEGGRGVDFSFAFSGANTGTPAVTVTGSFSVQFRETGDVVS